MTKRGWVLFAAMGIIWGIPYLLIKVAVEDFSPATLVFLRTAGAAAILLPLAAARGQLSGLAKYWRPLLVFTVIELCIPWLLLAQAETKLSSSLAGLLVAAVPLLGAALAWATRGETLGRRRGVGLLIGFAGVAALVGLDFQVDSGWALLQMAFVVVGYAVGPLVLVRYLSGAPQLGVVASSLAITALIYAPAGFAQWPRHGVEGKATAAVVALTLICTALGFALFFSLIAEAGPVRATVITYINPAVAIVLGVIFLDEPLTIGICVGFALVLTGSVLAARRDAKPTEPEAVPKVPPAQEAATLLRR